MTTLRSWRTPLTPRRLFGAVCAALLAPALFAFVSPPAQAAGGSAQVTMVCLLHATGYNFEPYPYDTGVSFQLDVPKSVKPGETVALKGVVALQFPEELRASIKSYVSTIDGSSDTLSVRLGINGRTTQLRADRWQTGKQPLGNPMVVKAPVSFPAFTVPANATGSITIDLPRNDVTKNTAGSNPAKVAFTGKAVGYPWNYGYDLACYRRENGVGRIASIPVASTAAPTTAAPATGGQAPAAAAPAAAAPGAEPAAGNPFAAETSSADQSAAAPAAAATEAITPVSAEADGVRVPGWLLLFGGVGLSLLLAFYAAWLHLRLRAIKNLT